MFYSLRFLQRRDRVGVQRSGDCGQSHTVCLCLSLCARVGEAHM
jgi:hypothetical protein